MKHFVELLSHFMAWGVFTGSHTSTLSGSEFTASSLLGSEFASPHPHWMLSLLQILIHATADATNSLMQFCKKSLQFSEDKLFAPKVGEIVDATRESHIYQVCSSEVNPY